MVWLRHLKVVLKHERIWYALQTPVPKTLAKGTPEYASFNFDRQKKHKEDLETAICIMLGSVFDELLKQYEHMDGQAILLYLRDLYDS